MDEARTIRFYVAPVLFLMSLIWGAWFDPTTKQHIAEHLKQVDDLSKLIGFVAGGGFIAFAFGYIIGTLTYAVLRLFFCLKACCGGSRYHEAGFSHSALENIWLRTGHPGAKDLKQELEQELSAVVVFDFGIIREKYIGVHEWLVRRWNAFNIGATSITGLLLSFAIGHWMLCISFSRAWLVPVGIFLIPCFCVACFAWHDGRRMVAFMAQMPAELLRPRRGPGDQP